MKGFITGIAICVMAVNIYGQNTWVQRDSVGGPPKSACVGFSMNGFGFIGLGFDQFEYKRSLYLYNSNFDDWEKMNFRPRTNSEKKVVWRRKIKCWDSLKRVLSMFESVQPVFEG